MVVGPKVYGFGIRCHDGFYCYTALMTYNAISTIEYREPNPVFSIFRGSI